MSVIIVDADRPYTVYNRNGGGYKFIKMYDDNSLVDC